jgi:4a-hydroxytetrahydrobiopterin dehydratase
MNNSDIASKHCQPCEGGISPLDTVSSLALLEKLPAWLIQAGVLEKTFIFKNHFETMAFVNAIAWVSHRENHHPELTVGYKDCRVRYWTHAIGGLSKNDFICAAKIERLLEI